MIARSVSMVVPAGMVRASMNALKTGLSLSHGQVRL
jgi:hypothetical protein